MARLQTVTELPKFLRRSKVTIAEDKRTGVVDFIALNPKTGISIGGGLRKIRIAREGGGKSRGHLTIYLFASVKVPIRKYLSNTSIL